MTYRNSISKMAVAGLAFALMGFTPGKMLQDHLSHPTAIPVDAFADSPWIDQTPKNTPPKIDNAQGRIFCPTQKTREENLQSNLGDHPSETDFAVNHFSIGMATLALGPDTAITARHIFMDENGYQMADPRSCYFEHLSTRKSYRILRAQFSAFSAEDKLSRSGNHRYSNDPAWVLLAEKPDGFSFIPESQVKINAVLTDGQSIVARFSFARNRNPGSQARKTIVYGKIMETPADREEQIPNFYGALISEGHGSSGGPVFDGDGEDAKLVGVISAGSHGEGAADQPWTSANHNSLIATFNSILMENYSVLRNNPQ